VVRLTERDLQVLELLVYRRAETLDFIHQGLFSDCVRKRALNRLGELCAGGILERFDVQTIDAPEPQSVYRLDRRGVAVVRDRCLAGEHLRGRRWNPILRSSSIAHQIATNRVGDILGTQIAPEHLQPAASASEARNRPDAIYLAHGNGRGMRVLVEVDLGHYSRRRLQDKIAAFHDRSDAGALIFVCPPERQAYLEWVAGIQYHGEGDLRNWPIRVFTFDELKHPDTLPERLRPFRFDDEPIRGLDCV